MKSTFMYRTLTVEEQEEILWDLFGFTIEDGTIFDENGEDFNNRFESLKYDLTNLSGITYYLQDRSISIGKEQCQKEIKNALGI